MSEREKLDNAYRKGRRAFYEGVPLEANPMRATDSRMYWEDAWLAAKKASEGIQRQFNGQPHSCIVCCIVCGRPAIGSQICFECLGEP